MISVDVQSVSFKYKGQENNVLDNVSFEIESGQIIAVTGPSGCGKSTLGYCICGIIPGMIKGEFSGCVTLKGRAGIVFQDPDTQIFLPTTEDELAFGPENLCLPGEEIGKRITEVLEITRLTDLRTENPSKLSDGRKQLTAFGGVLTMSPEILILDEPFSHLDISARETLKEIIISLKKRGGTIILIEHEKKNMEIADQVWYLKYGKLKKISSENGEFANE